MTTHAQQVPCTKSHLSDYARVKVDVAQTGFFSGREYRMFKEFTVPSGTPYVIKVVTTGNVILHGVDCKIDDGALRMSTMAGGTEGGSFSETIPIFNRNNMSVGPDREAVIASTMSLSAGGTHTGGTTLDVLRIKTSGGGGNAITVGANISDERGIAQGTYYFVLQNLGAGSVVGVLSIRWEERG